MGTIETLKKTLDVTEHIVKKNLPTIITIASSGGMVGSVILMAKEAPKASFKVEMKRELDPNFSKAEVIAVYCEECWPSIALGTASIIGVNYANHLNLGKIASLGAAYSFVVSDNKAKDKAIKVLEEAVGKEKVEEIKKKFEDKDPVVAESIGQQAYDVEKITKYGKNEKRPCVISWTGSEFYATYNELYAGIQKSKELFAPVGDAFYISLGDVLYNLHAPACDAGDELGFQNDFDAMITECVINGAVGWKVTFLSQPLPDYDLIN